VRATSWCFNLDEMSSPTADLAYLLQLQTTVQHGPYACIITACLRSPQDTRGLRPKSSLVLLPRGTPLSHRTRSSHSTQLTQSSTHCSDHSDGLAPRLVLAACGAPFLPGYLLLGRCPHDLPNVLANLSNMQQLTPPGVQPCLSRGSANTAAARHRDCGRCAICGT
jgi:hypothetical protein